MIFTAFAPALQKTQAAPATNYVAVDISASDGKIVRILNASAINNGLAKFGLTAADSGWGAANSDALAKADPRTIFCPNGSLIPFQDILVSPDIKFISVWGLNAATPTFLITRGELI